MKIVNLFIFKDRTSWATDGYCHRSDCKPAIIYENGNTGYYCHGQRFYPILK